jgi:hypothetical protein
LSSIVVTLVTAVATHASRTGMPRCERQFPGLRRSPLHRTMHVRAAALEMRANGPRATQTDVL